MAKLNKPPRLFHFLCTGYFLVASSIIILSAELIQFNLFGATWIFTPGLLIVPFIFFIEGIVTEVYGYDYARSMSQVGFLYLGILILILYLGSLLGVLTKEYPVNTDYYNIFASIPRHYIAFLIATYLGSLLHDTIISVMKRRSYQAIYLRFAFAPIIGEFLTDWLGVLLGRSGVLSFSEMFRFIIFAYVVKLIAEALLYWPKITVACLVKRYEDIDVIDPKNQNYNPLKVEISL